MNENQDRMLRTDTTTTNVCMTPMLKTSAKVNKWLQRPCHHLKKHLLRYWAKITNNSLKDQYSRKRETQVKWITLIKLRMLILDWMIWHKKISSSWFNKLKIWIRILDTVKIHHLAIFTKRMRTETRLKKMFPHLKRESRKAEANLNIQEICENKSGERLEA